MWANALGAEFRKVEERDHNGAPARVVIAERVYDTDRADLWDALTNAERIARWFTPVHGELRLGGRYQLEGNAGGAITRCDPPETFELTWEFAGALSWVNVRIAAEGARTRLTLEHIVPAADVDAHWAQFGPGAVGVGWDLAFFGLALHLGEDGEAADHDAAHAWAISEDGKAFMRESAAAWARAHIEAGEAPDIARGMAERTAAFYTGG